MINLDLESGLADHDNYHEYCRLLGRFRVNYQVFIYILKPAWLWISEGLLTYILFINLLQLSELVNVEGYSDWIRLVAEFTLKSLQSWQVDWFLSVFSYPKNVPL